MGVVITLLWGAFCETFVVLLLARANGNENIKAWMILLPVYISVAVLSCCIVCGVCCMCLMLVVIDGNEMSGSDEDSESTSHFTSGHQGDDYGTYVPQTDAVSRENAKKTGKSNLDLD